MEAAALELLKSSPIAGAMLILVFVFLKALEKRDERLSNIAKEFSATVDRNTNALIDFKARAELCKYKGEQ